MMERVVVTASAGTFPGLATALKSLPVSVEEYPLITFRAPPDWTPLDLALERLGSYRAVALTSPRAATALTDRIALRGASVWPRVNPPALWAGGAATAAALGTALGPVRVPAEQQVGLMGAGTALAAAMLEAGVRGPVLFACGNTHRGELPARLRREGTTVDEVVCYDSVLAPESTAREAAARATVVVVASPTVAQLLVRACPAESRPRLIAAGPTTGDSAQASGWKPAAVAATPTTAAVAAAVRTVLASRPSHE
jgi:uroporphyrinogen III methyltransferase / synthase